VAEGSNAVELTREQRLAAAAFLAKCTVPIAAEARGRANVVGTGTLFDFGDGPCLITAAHVLKGPDWDVEHLTMPETWGGRTMHKLGTVQIRRERNWDLAILQLQTPEIVQRIRANWQILSGQDVDAGVPPGLTVSAGFPYELARVEGGKIHARWIAMFEPPYVPLENERPEESELAKPGDMLVRYPETVLQPDGSLVGAPRSLEALSGGSAWRVVPEVDGIWTAQKALRVVGIQIGQARERSGEARRRYVRVRSWKVISALHYHGQEVPG